jgi:hypothetical protein
MLKELHRWFSKTADSTILTRIPQPVKEFIVSLLRIDRAEHFESWDEILEIVANLESSCF